MKTKRLNLSQLKAAKKMLEGDEGMKPPFIKVTQKRITVKKLSVSLGETVTIGKSRYLVTRILGLSDGSFELSCDKFTSASR